jgi:hypothetical protein
MDRLHEKVCDAAATALLGCLSAASDMSTCSCCCCCAAFRPVLSRSYSHVSIHWHALMCFKARLMVRSRCSGPSERLLDGDEDRQLRGPPTATRPLNTTEMLIWYISSIFTAFRRLSRSRLRHGEESNGKPKEGRKGLLQPRLARLTVMYIQYMLH